MLQVIRDSDEMAQWSAVWTILDELAVAQCSILQLVDTNLPLGTLDGAQDTTATPGKASGSYMLCICVYIYMSARYDGGHRMTESALPPAQLIISHVL